MRRFPGDVTGEFSLLADSVRCALRMLLVSLPCVQFCSHPGAVVCGAAASAVAASPVTALVVSRTAVDTLLKDNPSSTLQGVVDRISGSHSSGE